MNEANNTSNIPPCTGGGGEFSQEECKRTCKRNFWTEVLRTVVKVGTAILAAFGLASCIEEN